MNVVTFFEQLALQLGVGRIKELQVRRKKKIQKLRCIYKRPNLQPVLEGVWELFHEVRIDAYRHFHLHDTWIIRSKHIARMRLTARRVAFDGQRQMLLAGDRPLLQLADDVWQHWHDDVFEDFVKQLGFEPAAVAPSPTE